MTAPTMDLIVNLAKRRGFVFPSSDLYGGLAGFWDYGPLGVELKNNIKAAWWRHMVQLRSDVVGLDAAIMTSQQTLTASGHVAGFSDPLVDCRNCKARFRADALKGDPLTIPCPACGQRGTLTAARQFNLMFSTQVGPVANSASLAYLRPETAQGIFLNFANVVGSSRPKLPFGIAQIGKSFRNEITPGNFIFRMREFEQAECEFFSSAADEDTWFAYWVTERMRWWHEVLGVNPERLRLRPHDQAELSHYSRQTTDIEYAFPMGWSEVEGVADRGSFDLAAHSAASGKKLELFDQASGAHIVPRVIEPALGLDRALLAVLVDAYEEETVDGRTRVVLHLASSLAPIKAAVLPLQSQPELIEIAQRLTGELKQSMTALFDDSASIGKLYRRQDEIGTPFCVTIDPKSLSDGCATIRERDSLTQERVPLDAIPARLTALLSGAAAWAGVARA